MSRPVQERLLPDTDALPHATVEIRNYRCGRGIGFLVRFRHLDGMTNRQIFKEADQAHFFFLECCDRLKGEILRRKNP